LFYSGTDTASLSPLCWKELHSFSLQSSTDVQNDTLHLGLQLTLEAIRSLTSHYSQKRLSNKNNLYNLIKHDFVPHILQFMKILCNSLLEESISQIELGNVSPDEGLI
jgi:hypothetical protein